MEEMNGRPSPEEFELDAEDNAALDAFWAREGEAEEARKAEKAAKERAAADRRNATKRAARAAKRQPKAD